MAMSYTYFLCNKLQYTDLFTEQEGPLAFWTGFGAYYGRCAPHAMIILMTSERVKVLYDSAFGITK